MFGKKKMEGKLLNAQQELVSYYAEDIPGENWNRAEKVVTIIYMVDPPTSIWSCFTRFGGWVDVSHLGGPAVRAALALQVEAGEGEGVLQRWGRPSLLCIRYLYHYITNLIKHILFAILFPDLN